MEAPPTPTPAAIAAYTAPLETNNLKAKTLRDAVRVESTVVLYFLRHLHCLHCRALVAQLYALRTNLKLFPKIVFVHQEPLAVALKTFNELYPGAAHIADEHLELYDLFEVNRTTGLELFKPANVARLVRLVVNRPPGWRNLLRNFQPSADYNLLSGMFLFQDGQLVWCHRASSPDDDGPALRKLAV